VQKLHKLFRRGGVQVKVEQQYRRLALALAARRQVEDHVEVHVDDPRGVLRAFQVAAHPVEVISDT
jgi:hypothetical protein